LPIITLTPLARAACVSFGAAHGAPVNVEQLEAVVAQSLDNLFTLFADERWILAADTQRFAAMGINHRFDRLLQLHARRNDDESWTVGTPEEFPVSAEYLRRREESELAIIRRIGDE
jgi:hypothetical protein